VAAEVADVAVGIDNAWLLGAGGTKSYELHGGVPLVLIVFELAQS
jgi:hypothetical protein